MAAANGGHLNLTLRVTSPARPVEERFLSRYFAADGGPLRSALAGATGAWLVRPDEPAEDLHVSLPAAGAIPAKDAELTPQDANHCYVYYKLVERKDRVPTVVGELHTGVDVVNARFEYGRRADSNISVAVKAAGEQWALQGEHHVGNTGGAKVGRQKVGSNFHSQILSAFDYGRFERHNPCARTREVIRALEWHPSSTERFYPNPGCDPRSEFASKFGPNAYLERDSQRAITWVGAASAFGVSLSARSGYSRFVVARWDFGTEELHYLCGSDAKVHVASRIFAGPPYVEPVCRPGRPC